MSGLKRAHNAADDGFGMLLREALGELVRTADPRRWAILLGVLALALGALNALDGPTTLSSFTALVALPPLLSAVLLAGAADVALVAARERAGAARTLWLLLGAALACAALDQALALHERADTKLDAGVLVTGAPAWIPALVLLVVVLAVARERGTGLVLAAAAWCASVGLALVPQDPAGSVVWVRGMLELVASAALLLVLVAMLQREPGYMRQHRAPELWPLVERACLAARPRRLAVGIVLTVGTFGVLGSLVEEDMIGIDALGLRNEQTLPALFSGLLLAAAGLMAALLARRGPLDGRSPRWWSLFAACFAFLALDEWLGIHDQLTDDDTHGQVVLLPLVLAAAACWCVAMLRLEWERSARLLLLGGAACWAAAQSLDILSHGPPQAWATALPEELLEMVGSGLFALALLVAVRTALEAPQGEPVLDATPAASSAAGP